MLSSEENTYLNESMKKNIKRISYIYMYMYICIYIYVCIYIDIIIYHIPHMYQCNVITFLCNDVCICIHIGGFGDLGISINGDIPKWLTMETPSING